MRKLIIYILLTLVSPFSFAQEAKGTIEQIQICGTGTKGWARTIQFKVNGKWFGIYADYHSGSGRDYDNNISTSMLYMAFSQNLEIDIKATDTWKNIYKKCGINQGAVFHQNAGDFIRLSK
nr:hypothetical protein [uncultured Vibrio sp.]